MEDVTSLVRNLTDAEASGYEKEPGHGISSPTEETAWRRDILDAVKLKPGAVVLEVGAGTGVLTRMLAEWVGANGHVVAMDLSQEMIEQNRKLCKSLLPSEFQSRVHFENGDAHQERQKDSTHQLFDYIVCRQVVCLLADPLAVFKQWYKQLNNGGKVIILDVMWQRSSWGGGWNELVDRLPLSCLQNFATVPYLLKQAGFVIDEARLLVRVNECFAVAQADDFNEQRYIVVASK